MTSLNISMLKNVFIFLFSLVRALYDSTFSFFTIEIAQKKNEVVRKWFRTQREDEIQIHTGLMFTIE